MKRLLIFSGLFLFLSFSSFAENLSDGKIRFYTYYLKETPEIQYRRGDKIFPEAMEKIQHLFRSRDSNREMPIDPRLIEIIDTIEDHFQVRQVEVISGYRSQAFNQELKATGHHVANESFHTKGMAADIHLDEISEESVRDFALSLKKGGVGYYPSLNMVHVDAGPVRFWEEKAERKTWVGEKNPAVSTTISVTPDRAFGEKGKKMPTIQFEPASDREKFSEGEVQFFEGSEWKTIDSKSSISSWPYGKYRLKFPLKDSSEFQYSNEFYFKRQ